MDPSAVRPYVPSSLNDGLGFGLRIRSTENTVVGVFWEAKAETGRMDGEERIKQKRKIRRRSADNQGEGIMVIMGKRGNKGTNRQDSGCRVLVLFHAQDVQASNEVHTEQQAIV